MNVTNDTAATKRAWRNVLKRKVCSRTDFSHNPQNVHTPYDLCYQMVSQLEKATDLLGKTFATTNLEFAEILHYSFGVEKKNIWYVTECLEKAKVALKHDRYSGINVLIENYLSLENKNMKFDVIVGNPPYQTKSDVNDRKTQPLWHKFVAKSFELLKEDGYLCMVHPSGWRNVAGVFKDTQNLLKSKDMQFLKLHRFREGQTVFGVAINFDYYVIRNRPNKGLTTVVFEDGSEDKIDISKLEFIPSENFKEIQSLIAKDGEEQVEVLYDRTAYGSDKKNMSKEKTDKFKYPCVYTVKSPDNDNRPTFWYSDNKDNGHFGIPKVVWANGASGVFVDHKGEYGLTQFAYAIVDAPENLENIKKALQSERFVRKIMGFKESLGDKYNRKVIALFRKDFWKEFIN